MLEEINLSKKLDKKEYKLQKPALEARLAALQRECRRLQIPVMVVFEGWGASGKGTLINNLILPLDPRGFSVYTIKSATCDEQMRPFLWRFWTKTPPAGRMAVFDRSWYRRVMNERVNRDATPSEVQAAYAEISSFEEQLTQSGVVMIKFFLHISEQEQKKRLEKLEKNPNTAWRVTGEDWENHRRYAKFLKSNDEMLEKTDTGFAPWTIVEANDEAFATVKIMSTAITAWQRRWLSARPGPSRR